MNSVSQITKTPWWRFSGTHFWCNLIFVSIVYFWFYRIDPLHPHPEPSREDTTGQMVHAVWWWWETEVDWGSARCGNCQGCQTHQLCRGMGLVSIICMYALVGCFSFSGWSCDMSNCATWFSQTITSFPLNPIKDCSKMTETALSLKMSVVATLQ